MSLDTRDATAAVANLYLDHRPQLTCLIRRTNLRSVAVRARAQTVNQLKIVDVARDTGLHRNTVMLLYQETASRIDLDAMDRLCTYFKIPDGELFEFVPENEKRKKT
jgi:putative transcriptional regulator